MFQGLGLLRNTASRHSLKKMFSTNANSNINKEIKTEKNYKLLASCGFLISGCYLYSYTSDYLHKNKLRKIKEQRKLQRLILKQLFGH